MARRHPRPARAASPAISTTAAPGSGAAGRARAGRPSRRRRRPAGERPADVLRDVVVAEAHRVGVAVRPEPHLRGGPDADAGQAAQPPVDLLAGQADRALQRGATRAAPTTARERAGSMCIRSHSQDGMPRTVAGAGCTHSRRSAPGPGAARRTGGRAVRKPANASWPVTFCSMIAGTSASITRPVRAMRQWPVPVQVGHRVVVGTKRRGRRRRPASPARRRAPTRRAPPGGRLHGALGVLPEPEGGRPSGCGCRATPCRRRRCGRSGPPPRGAGSRAPAASGRATRAARRG